MATDLLDIRLDAVRNGLDCGLELVGRADGGERSRPLGRTLPIVGKGIVGQKDAEISLLHAGDGALAFADAVKRGIERSDSSDA